MVRFIGANFAAIWPFLLITIPIAVGVNLLGASKYINRALLASPLLAIGLATVVGAFSPFCSCTVIPIVAALLIGGVPLAPVMAFWIASPSMDPEIFFLSVATLGWPLAVWRLAATIVISLGAGFITHLAVNRGWLGTEILRDPNASPLSLATWFKKGWRWLLTQLKPPAAERYLGAVAGGGSIPLDEIPVSEVSCCGETAGPAAAMPESPCGSDACSLDTAPEPAANSWRSPAFRSRLWTETRAATWLVVRFMILAFFLEGLIVRYVPEAWIVGLLGGENPLAILSAALLGVPVYTSNLAALPLVGGLLQQGMAPGAALAFLIAGPMTTLPAMTAVWQLAARRVFALYVGFALFGAVAAGYLLSWLG